MELSVPQPDPQLQHQLRAQRPDELDVRPLLLKRERLQRRRLHCHARLLQISQEFLGTLWCCQVERPRPVAVESLRLLERALDGGSVQ